MIQTPLLEQRRWDIDAVYVPEMEMNIKDEAARLLKVMDEKDCVNIFLSEGAGLESIVAEIEAQGGSVTRDAFGHVALDEVNPGQWFAKQFSAMLKAEKILVQKSGYFARSAAPNRKDLELIFKSCDLAVEFGQEGLSGVIGLDEEANDKLTCIEFDRIRGGKPFDITQQWFVKMLRDIGQKEE